MRFLIVVITLLVLSVLPSYSQNNLLRFTDYDVTKPLINPAAMGLEEGVEGLLLYRSRFEKAEHWPSTGALNINSIFSSKGLGGGLSVIYDKHGPYQKIFAYIAGVYRLQVNEKNFLYFGLQFGINYVSSSGDYRLADEEFIYSENYSQPNYGFGLHFKNEKFFLGFSIPEFKYNTIDEQGNKVTNMMSDKLKVYLYGGYEFRISEQTKLTPLAYLYYSEEEDTQIDLGAKLSFKKNFEIGARYRTSEAFGVTARVRLFEELWLGYSYEGNSSDSDDRFNSNQEITLTFRLGKKSQNDTQSKEQYEDINSIRYF
ncbi:PorP/SprF family type IX secretion system membrane protein [Odoribacter sp. OttesenSCG-928-J03]|nr:PorP/SprF family type IX secretion system membrane protein [Odoribacter sp. OttesenSCG-928-J03]MDL2283398.1 PorP/SprF family type IX secretion system membrane protein [Odoribacter sp. OttesenSCG-928-G04]